MFYFTEKLKNKDILSQRLSCAFFAPSPRPSLFGTFAPATPAQCGKLRGEGVGSDSGPGDAPCALPPFLPICGVTGSLERQAFAK